MPPKALRQIGAWLYGSFLLYCGHKSRPIMGNILPLYLIQTSFFLLEKGDLANLLKFVLSVVSGQTRPVSGGLNSEMSADRLNSICTTTEANGYASSGIIIVCRRWYGASRQNCSASAGTSSKLLPVVSKTWSMTARLVSVKATIAAMIAKSTELTSRKNVTF